MKNKKFVPWGFRYQSRTYLNAKLQKGGTISELGYKDNSPFKNNPFLDINSPNGSITMQNVSTPLLGVDNLGNVKTMFPNKEYGFPGSTITEMPLAKNGGLIKRADGSYSKHGLWDSIRENKGSGKKPTSQMLEQERKISKQEGGYINPFMQQGGMSKSNYDFLFGDDDEEENTPIAAPSTQDIDNLQQEREQFNQEKLDWTNQKQYDEAMQEAMSSNEEENENDKLYEGIFTPIDNKLPSFQSTSFPNLRTTSIPNFNSNGTFGMQNVSPLAINIGNTIADGLGYKPTFNSIYRDEKLNTSVGGKPNSYHLKGEAIDLKPSDWNNLPKEKQQELKSQYTVVNEGNHIHFQPKKQMGGVLYSSGQTLNNLSYDDIIRLKKQGYKFSFQE